MKYIIAAIICLLSVSIFMFISDIEVDNYEDIEKLSIEIRGEVNNEKVIEVDRGLSLIDIIDEIDVNDNGDLSVLSLEKPLYNNQIIVVPKISSNELISINNAGIERLVTLPGIGNEIAKNIIEYREIHGGFQSIEEIKNVKGIGDKKFEKFKEFICL